MDDSFLGIQRNREVRLVYRVVYRVGERVGMVVQVFRRLIRHPGQLVGTGTGIGVKPVDSELNARELIYVVGVKQARTSVPVAN